MELLLTGAVPAYGVHMRGMTLLHIVCALSDLKLVAECKHGLK